MSNAKENPSFYQGFTPGLTITRPTGVTTRQELFELPNGREAMVETHVGEMQPEEQRAKDREEFLLTVYPPSLTENLEREIASMTAQFTDLVGYDRQGQPIMRVQGRAREVLEMKLANRRNALALAKQERALAERVQAHAKAQQEAETARIDTAAKLRAQELIEEAEIERRAQQIAYRTAGVKS